MSRVLQAVDSIHQVGLYCLALVPHNHLPKTPLGKFETMTAISSQNEAIFNRTSDKYFALV
jgi:hypothetical protein